MEARDLIVTPLLLMFIYTVAYFVRPFVTNEITRRYFFPAITVKIVGALGVGFLYQFYYGGGDTFMYHTHGSRLVWNAFMESSEAGIKLLFADGSSHTGIYRYSSQIYFYKDPQSYAVIRIASFFDLFTFSTYSSTAILFALVSFTGMWMFFLTFYIQYPQRHRGLAIATLFIPSVFFWGSGLLKDTITLGCLGLATYLTFRIFIQKKLALAHFFLLMISLYALFVIKIYILLTFLPAAIFWIFVHYYNGIHSFMLKLILFPFVISISLSLGFLAMSKAAEDNPKYSLQEIANTAKVTAYDIRYWSGREAGSGYSLGELDGSWESLVKLAPQAINVTLFRPFLWEVKNPLMLLAALESVVLFFFTLYVLARIRSRLPQALMNPAIIFCLVFSLTFAFAVGVSTFNFGTLARYKIPMLPFYFVALVLMLNYSKSDKNEGVFERTE